jgi:hypothetical protein
VPAESTLRKGEGDGYEQKESYLRFFKRVCAKHNIGWINKERKLILFDEDKIATQEVAYKLLWRRAPTSGAGAGGYEIPIKEVTINPLLTLFAGLPGVKGQQTSKVDLDKNTAIQKKLNDTNVPGRTSPTESKQTVAGPQPNPPATVDTTAGGVVADPPLPTCATGDHHTASSREPNTEGRAKTEVTRTSQLANTMANVVIPGHPGIHPQMIVEVIGLPGVFSGRYLVKKVKHSLGGAYNCELELFSRVVNQDPSSGEGQRAKGASATAGTESAGGDQPTVQNADNKATR